MIAPIDWLPPIIPLTDFGGNWESYLDAIYEIFTDDFVRKSPVFEGTTLKLKRHPMSQGKEATFWHLISEGNNETNRLVDLRRCERIRWPSPIIEQSGDTRVKVWENERRGEQRICLWLYEHEYLVILAKRSGYILLWTAYMVIENNRKRRLLKEYEDYHRGN